ncbi:facilitated trehalose transporter Tret1-like isoform X2 [Sitophilus oryzae]|uniref:Facilitated trehalose transporter Tret1-like isoform X2 n=1 Tax=Sitophilus oryzae TaxID=7048 RepID=A0A6J2XTK8_SITOR|nr:facilitated trehalose transporter Tret1-like isoform X2 [Sitophilus oryzae]
MTNWEQRAITENVTSTETTYIFEVQENNRLDNLRNNMKTGVWQIFPSVCASLAGIPFGLMLGWPSPTYHTLLQSDSPIPITLDQSAMVAGFLMLGMSFGTLWSSRQIGPGSKYGIVLGNVLVLVGWVIMWQSRDVFWLLGSRFTIGSGYGYALGQIKCYIQEMTDKEMSVVLTKLLTFYALTGFFLAFAIGTFIDFRRYSLISLIITVFILFLAVFLPSTPKELIKTKKLNDAKKLLAFLKPNLDPQQETYSIIEKMSRERGGNAIAEIYRNRELRNNFLRFSMSLFFQQYSGAPPTLVYTEVIFRESHVPFPEYFAIVYAFLFLLANIFGVYVSTKYNKRRVLIFSSCITLFLYICKIFVIYNKVNDKYFSYTTVIIMYLFIIFHTIGLGSIPFTFISNWFPPSCQLFMTKYFTILHCIFALTITKVFQVLLGNFDLYISFCLFLLLTLLAIIFIIIFIPSEYSYQSDIQKIKPNINSDFVEKADIK